MMKGMIAVLQEAAAGPNGKIWVCIGVINCVFHFV